MSIRPAVQNPSIEETTLLEAVLETIPDGLIVFNEQGIIQRFNKAAERIFGYPADEVTGRHLRMLIPAPLQTEQAGYLHEYLIPPQKRTVIGRELPARRKDHSLFPAELDINEMMLEGERHYVLILRDITARKQSEDIIQDYVDKLTESNTELERFAFVASHDLQEPIRMIVSFCQLLSQEYGGRLDESGREYLGIIRESGERMRDVVTDLLNYSRLDNESVPPINCDSGRILQAATENLQALIQERGAQITHDPLPQLSGYPIQLMRLLQNLIANAIKYQPKGNSPRIHITADYQNDQWLFSVKDNGLGIDPQFIEQIFQPFRRLHVWDQIRGSGLGLAICQKIVENHGGRLWAESKPGEGSVFYFTLPVPQAQKSRRAS